MKNIPPQQLRSLSPNGDETTIHLPVLLEDTVRLLNPKIGETYLDLTAGYGGHARKIIDVIGAKNATLVDRDARAIDYLSVFTGEGANVVHSDFASFTEEVTKLGKQFDMVLVDLGVSSPQFDMAERGFSIQRDGPLDMRMDESTLQTAAEIVNFTSEKDLARMIVEYGEERPKRAAAIAHTIRLNRPIRSTSQLASVILKSHRGGYQKIHPATRTFQAIRIAVNQELLQLSAILPRLGMLLKPGGRAVVISFHSLEDRLVKQYFAEAAKAGYEAEFRILTKKPVLGAVNDVHNPRARSAILRAAVKI